MTRGRDGASRHLPVRDAPTRLPASGGRVFVVVNPTARHAEAAVAELDRQCHLLGLPAARHLATTVHRPGCDQAREAVEAGADLVVVIGGDGTVRQVVRVLAGTSTRLGVIPLGSGNVLAHNLGLVRLSLAQQVDTALTGPSVELDVGWAHLVTASGAEHDEPFLTMAGIGRDARSVAGATHEAKMRLGWLAYAAAGLKEALLPALRMSVRVDDEPEHTIDTWTVLVGLTPAAPGRVVIHPDALVDDGLFDILEVPIRHPAQWLSVALKGLVWHQASVAALRNHTGRRVLVRPLQAQPVQVDGDVIRDVTAMAARIQERSLRVHVRDPEEPA